MHDLRYDMNWRPAYGPGSSRSVLAQSPPAETEPPISQFMGSPTVALVTDVTAASLAGYVAYHLGRINSGWATFWWVVTTASVMKGLHDWKRVNKP